MERIFAVVLFFKVLEKTTQQLNFSRLVKKANQYIKSAEIQSD